MGRLGVPPAFERRLFGQAPRSNGGHGLTAGGQHDHRAGAAYDVDSRTARCSGFVPSDGQAARAGREVREMVPTLHYRRVLSTFGNIWRRDTHTKRVTVGEQVVASRGTLQAATCASARLNQRTDTITCITPDTALAGCRRRRAVFRRGIVLVDSGSIDLASRGSMPASGPS